MSGVKHTRAPTHTHTHTHRHTHTHHTKQIHTRTNTQVCWGEGLRWTGLLVVSDCWWENINSGIIKSESGGLVWRVLQHAVGPKGGTFTFTFRTFNRRFYPKRLTIKPGLYSSVKCCTRTRRALSETLSVLSGCIRYFYSVEGKRRRQGLWLVL